MHLGPKSTRPPYPRSGDARGRKQDVLERSDIDQSVPAIKIYKMRAMIAALPGIEILDARKRCGDPEVFKRVVLEDVALSRPAAAMESQ